MLNINIPSAFGAWLNRLTGQEGDLHADASDTVMRWPPTAARVLASSERHAHKSLMQVLALEHPKGFLLSHVPLHKLVRVPRNHSYREWLSRTGLLTVDFALCDEHGYVRTVVLMPVTEEQQRLLRRRERLQRVLHATDLVVEEWDREWMNEASELLRHKLFPAVRGSGFYSDAPHAPH